ncbi:MAG: glycosyltransferase [Planctomycetaceae bacterium]
MNEPLVSIIIPCYNAAEFVAEAIESAAGQTYGNVEVIVIDDGSTDESVDVLRSFGDRIRWETGPNRGACAARNRGLELAQGEIVQFLDSDDLLHPGKLDIQVPLLSIRQNTLCYCHGDQFPLA